MSRQSVILAKICTIYDDSRFVAQSESTFKKILKCADLNRYFVLNSNYLVPYTYNEGYARTFKNQNEQYDVFTGLDNIFSNILSDGDDDDIGRLLIELGNNIPAYNFDYDAEEGVMVKLKNLQSLYELVGFRLIHEEGSFGVEPFTSDSDRFENITEVENWLENSFEGVFSAYKGALDSFVSNNYGTCIESCRTVLTGIFSKYKGPDDFAKWFRGTANISGEMTDITSLKAAIEATGKNDLSDFFEENNTGSYKKTRAIYAIYSMMSDYGTHREEGTVETPSRADALMMYRMMQDIVLWIYQTKEV